MGFNSAFKGLMNTKVYYTLTKLLMIVRTFSE